MIEAEYTTAPMQYCYVADLWDTYTRALTKPNIKSGKSNFFLKRSDCGKAKADKIYTKATYNDCTRKGF